jgi:hypothetical protein
MWLWGAPKVGKDGVTTLLMDTEGLGDAGLGEGRLQRSEQYDAQIFALSILLSSLFIYNTIGNINQDAIGKLSMVANLCKMVKVNNNPNQEEQGTSFANFFPTFMWLLRDVVISSFTPNSNASPPKTKRTLFAIGDIDIRFKSGWFASE